MKILLLLSLCAVALGARAATTPVAIFSANDPNPGDQKLEQVLTVDLLLLDDAGLPVRKVIVADASTAGNAATWTLEWTGTTPATPFAFARVQRRPSAGGLVSEFSAPAPDLGKADPSKTSWHLKISGSAGKPALTFLDASGKRQVVQNLDLPVKPLPKIDKGFIGTFKPMEPKVSVEGGSDGALFGIELAYKSPFHINDRNEIFGFHADFEGTFTPDPDDTPTLYGRYAGNAGLLKGFALPTNSVISGSLLVDVNTRFEADQQARNYNYTVGVGVWGFVSLAPLEWASAGLRRALSFGHEITDTASVLTLFAGYDSVVDSKREAEAGMEGDQRMRFRARYRVPLVEKLRLPLVSTLYQVDGVADFSGVYEFKGGRFLPEWKASLEFAPLEAAQGKMAFVISYQEGKITPTFADEEAFLAGLKLRF